MNSATQRTLARTFRDRHTTAGADPLVLPNAWDAASTIIYKAAGFDAVGTSSAGVAAALGAPDGEHVSRDEMLAVLDRIAHSVDIPVSADIEAGYGTTPQAVAETVRQTIDAGAVGINLEDGYDEAAAGLVDREHHVATIRAARETASDAEVPIVINGRTDVFWRAVGPEADRVDRAVGRANAYLGAGSDCAFVPGVTDLDTIDALVDGIDGPLNVLGGPGVPSIPALAAVGVARVSVGSGPMRATLGLLREISDELRTNGTYDGMGNAIPYDELHELLADAAAGRAE